MLRHRGVRGIWRTSATRESLDWLRKHGFKVNSEVESHEEIGSVLAACRRWEERREELDFEIDGVVVKIDDYDVAEALGVVGP